MRVVVLPHTCANLACPNEVDQGAFVLVESEGDLVGGKRPLRLWLCFPCGSALHGVL
jgi:hypothetical protein